MLSAACSALLVAVGMIAIGSPASAATTVTADWELREEMLCQMEDACEVVLGADITAAELQVPSGKSVTVDLAGYQLDAIGSAIRAGGIWVPGGATLIIEDSAGTGVLDATGNDGAAGIGGRDGKSGVIALNGGAITAVGGSDAAGIGGGDRGAGGDVTIAAGANVTASSDAGIAVGAGVDGGGFGSLDNAGTLTIPTGNTLPITEGVTVTNSGALTGAGELANGGAIVSTGTIDPGLTITGHYYQVSFDANAGSDAPAPVVLLASSFSGADAALPESEPTRMGYRFTGWYLSSSATGDPVDAETVLSTEDATDGPAPVTLYAGWAEASASQTSVASGTNPALDTDTVTYTATIDPVPDGGTVEFLDRETVIAECAEVPVDAAGHATCTHSSAEAGNYVISAAFSGSADLAASTSERFVQAVYSTRTGHVVAWGANVGEGTYPGTPTGGQIDVPAGLDDVIAVAAGGDHSLALRADGTIVGWGDNRAGELDIPSGLSGVVDIEAGTQYSVALQADGTVVAWGRNDFGQATVPTGLTDVVAITASTYHCVALKSDGSAVAWGNNEHGELAVPDDLFAAQIDAGTFHNLALLPNGTVRGWGAFTSGQTFPPPGLAGVTQVSGGGQFSLALTDGGSVVGWGYNGAGETDVPDLTNAVEVEAGAYHGLARLDGGTVVAWGDDEFGQTDVPADLEHVYALAAGTAHTLALVWTPPVINIGTTTSLGSSANPSDTGEEVTFIADVVANPGGGTVTFFDGSTALCTDVPVDAETGEATCTHTFTAGGSHAITATFSGFDQYLASTSEALTQVVGTPVEAPTITTSTLADGTVGTTYSAFLTASGGTAPYDWEGSGDLPPGLLLNGNQISGVPTAPGTSTFTVTVTDANNQQDSQELSITIEPAPFSQEDSTLTADPATVVADGSTASTLTVTVVDTAGAPMVGKTVALAADGGSSTISTPSGASDADGVVTFTVTDTVAEQVTYTASVDGVDLTDTAEVTFMAGPVSGSNSSVTAAPAEVPADGATASTVTVTALDANDNPVPGQEVTLAAGGGSSVVSDPSGVSDADGVVTFTVTDTVAEQVSYTATAGDTPLTETATITFTAGAVSAGTSTVIASPASVVADGETASTVTVTLLDAQGNPVPGQEVTLAAGGGSSVVFEPSGASDADGVVTFTVTDTVAEQVTYTATAGDTPLTETAAVTFTAGPVSAGTSTVTASPASVVADGETASTIAVTVLDANENPVVGQSVSLAAGGGSSTVSAPSGESGSDGVVTFTVTDTVAEQVSYTASVGQLELDQTVTVSFTAGALSAGTSTVTASPASVVADGEAVSTVTVTVLDAQANPVPGQQVTLTAGGGSSVVSEPSGASDADGVVTFTVTDTVAEQVTYTATAGDTPLTETAAVTFTAGDVSPAASTVTASPTEVVADGATASTITVTVLDANENPVVGQSVSLAAGGGSSVVSDPSGVSDANGVVTFTVTDTVAEQVTYTATVGDIPITQAPIVTFVAGPVSADHSTMTAVPASVVADGQAQSRIIVTLRDALDNPVIDQQVQLSADSSTTVIAPGSVTSEGVTTFLVSNTVAEQVIYTASAGGTELAQDARVLFTPGAVSVADSTLTAEPATVVADGESASTLTTVLVDAQGNPVPGQAVTLLADGGSSTIAPATATSGTDGAVTFTVTNTVAEAVTYSATVSAAVVPVRMQLLADGDLTLDATATVTFIAGPVSATESALTAEPTTVMADGQGASTLTVTLRDAQGNAVAGESVSLAADGGSSDISAPSGVSDDGGVVTFTVTDTVAEQVTYTASTGGTELAAAAMITFVSVPSAPQDLAASGGDGQVQLTWTAPADDGQSPVLGYLVYRSTEAGERGDALTDEPIEQASFTDTDVTNRTTYFYTVTAVNAVGDSAASDEVEVTPVAPLTVTTAELPEGTVGTAYGAELEATGGLDSEYTWALAAGDLPPGLELAADGTISGTPTKAGTYSFTVTVNDPVPADLVIVIAPADVPPPAGDGDGSDVPADNPPDAEGPGRPGGESAMPGTGFGAGVAGLAGVVLLGGLVLVLFGRRRAH